MNSDMVRYAHHGRRPATPLPADLADVLAAYARHLKHTRLSSETRRTYVSRIRQFLAWLASSGVAPMDALTADTVRRRAVHAYRNALLSGPKRPRSGGYVNNTLAALDDFYRFLGLGATWVDRVCTAGATYRTLDENAQRRWLLAAHTCASNRDTMLALIPLYADLKVRQIVALDVDDVAVGGRDRIGGTEIHSALRRPLRNWLAERAEWPRADAERALFLNRRGGRLSARSISAILSGIAERAGLDRRLTAPLLRRTKACDGGW